MAYVIKVGTVTESKDTTRSGTLTIQPDVEDGQVGEASIQATMGTPSLGSGYGFVHIPGPGARVLYANLRTLGASESPDNYVWFCAIAFPLVQAGNMNVLANDSLDPSDFYAGRIDLHPPTDKAGATELKIDCGLPNNQSIYGDNDLPQAAVWKAAPGHFLQFSNKVTKWGTHDVATLLMNASGKYIKMDDGPPTEGMDRITISDEMWEYGGNRIEILTGDPDKPNSIYVQSKQDQDYVSVEGSQVMAITDGEGAQIRENMATGGIHDIAYTADHSITAETDINRTSETGNISETAKEGDISITSDNGSINITANTSITITCGQSVIELTPTAINISSLTVNQSGTGTMTLCAPAGDVTIGPTSLMLHEHFSPFFGLPTLGHPVVPTPCVP